MESDEVVFRRTSCSQDRELRLRYDSFQCIISHASLDEKRVKQIPLATSSKHRPCLLLIGSESLLPYVFFDTEEEMVTFHEEILHRQGFGGHDRIKQYEFLGKLGQGTFGIVLLAKHKLSGIRVAVKMINKRPIEKAFSKVENHVYQEIQVVNEIARANCSNTLELIETFENSEDYVIVTKMMQGGDLHNYLTK